jgi:hypothetical protein
MTPKARTRLLATALALLSLVAAMGGRANAQPVPKPMPPHGIGSTEQLRFWNQVAIDASGLDHAPPAPGEDRVFREQMGPGRASRAMAIVQIAVFDSVNAIFGGYESYTGIAPALPNTSVDAAIAVAAHDTLVALFPAQTAKLDDALAGNLAGIRNGRPKTNGIALGQEAAAAILAIRSADGSQHAEPMEGVNWFTSDDPGHWRQDPISMLPPALGARWSEVTPFVLTSASQFRVPPPPALNSPEYTEAFNEVKRLGGDGDVTPTDRTEDQTIAGIYWAYDGTPSLCAPPRLYNQILVQIAQERGSNVVDLARLLAITNTAMADAGIAIWESKYYYDFWRPVTGVREADPGTGPSGLGDGNDDTEGIDDYVPLCAPASNQGGKNFTPPFPAYPSGHAGFGGALFQTLRNFYGTDDIAFTFVSDEFNGVTTDNDGNTRPLIPRSFANLSQAEEENGQSRIYLGIHWRFDKTEGIAQGRNVANYVFTHAFRPASGLQQ